MLLIIKNIKSRSGSARFTDKPLEGYCNIILFRDSIIFASRVKDYFFRHHLETNVENDNNLKGITWIRSGLNNINNITKVRINHLGQIVSVGEY